MNGERAKGEERIGWAEGEIGLKGRTERGELVVLFRIDILTLYRGD